VSCRIGRGGRIGDGEYGLGFLRGGGAARRIAVSGVWPGANRPGGPAWRRGGSHARLVDIPYDRWGYRRDGPPEIRRFSPIGGGRRTDVGSPGDQRQRGHRALAHRNRSMARRVMSCALHRCMNPIVAAHTRTVKGLPICGNRIFRANRNGALPPPGRSMERRRGACMGHQIATGAARTPRPRHRPWQQRPIGLLGYGTAVDNRRRGAAR
jgi:hypothetical protein